MFLPGGSRGQRSLVDHGTQGLKERDLNEQARSARDIAGRPSGPKAPVPLYQPLLKSRLGLLPGKGRGRPAVGPLYAHKILGH